MIKIALKHWMLEKCIDMIFSSIATNFSLIDEKNLKVGNKYSLIEARMHEGRVYFYDCEIIYRDRIGIEIMSKSRATFTKTTWGCAEVVEKTINRYVHISRIIKIS